jgi:ABC-type phosphate/phosphonate transport system substrate-binding protein
MDQVGSGGVRPRLDDMPRVALKTAKVVVILISPKYVEFTWAVSEEGYQWLAPRNKQQILGVLVQNTPKEQLAALPDYISLNATPLVEATTKDQDTILRKTVSLVGVFTEDTLAEHNASPEPEEP